MTEAVWSNCLSSAGRRSIRAARIACTVAGTSIAWIGRVSRWAPRPRRPFRLHQRPDALLDEEGVAAPNQEPLERLQPRIVTQEGAQELTRLSCGSASSRS